MADPSSYLYGVPSTSKIRPKKATGNSPTHSPPPHMRTTHTRARIHTMIRHVLPNVRLTPHAVALPTPPPADPSGWAVRFIAKVACLAQPLCSQALGTWQSLSLVRTPWHPIVAVDMVLRLRSRLVRPSVRSQREPIGDTVMFILVSFFILSCYGIVPRGLCRSLAY
jgi:hypothetical protein